MNYLVADFIIQIKNSYLANRKTIVVRYSNISKAIGQLLVKKQLLSEIKEEEVEGRRVLVVSLRYVRRKPAFTQVDIISKPSLRVYISQDKLHEVMRDDAIAVVSTSSGVMTGRDAMAKKVGGELLFKVR